MIKIKVSNLMGEHKLSARQLSKHTNITQPIIGTYYHETAKKFDLKALNSLCRYFNCEVSDILEYIPDDEE